MDRTEHLLGLLLGTEEDWPRAFEELVRRLGPVRDIFGRLRARERRSTCSRRSTGGQSSRPTPTIDAATSSSNTTWAPGLAASIARRPVSPAIAAPVPMASTCSTTADPVAAHGATPARCAISAMPATAHTFPGRYLPRLETVQIRAAPHPSSR